jgi:hypothetical protein
MLLGILTLAGAGLSAANFAPLDTPAVPPGRVEQPAATPPRPPRAPLRVTVDATAVLLRANLLVIARTAENDAVRRANLQISRAEAWLLAAHLPDEYAAALRDVLAGPLDARLRDVVLTRLEHAERREPPGGFRACPEWDSPGGPTAADRQAEPRLKATLAAAEPSVLAVSEYAGVLRRARREPDLVAAMADLHDGLHGRRGRRGGYVLLYKVDRTINCALDALWRRPD